MPTDGLGVALERLPPGWHAHYFEAVDSTQDEARLAARRGAPNRSLFVADFQRSGRGRRGRTWLAPPGAALLVWMLFRETNPAPSPFRWTSLASVALAESIERLLRLRPAIKWPNDLMLQSRKLAGILAETSWDGQHLVAVVGVGVNVNTRAADLASIPGPATSLCVECGHPVDRGELLGELVRGVERWLDLGDEQDVVVLGAHADGSLRVRMADGAERTTTTGELII